MSDRAMRGQRCRAHESTKDKPAVSRDDEGCAPAPGTGRPPVRLGACAKMKNVEGWRPAKRPGGVRGSDTVRALTAGAGHVPRSSTRPRARRSLTVFPMGSSVLALARPTVGPLGCARGKQVTDDALNDRPGRPRRALPQGRTNSGAVPSLGERLRTGTVVTPPH
jgi:hypothetical protein